MNKNAGDGSDGKNSNKNSNAGGGGGAGGPHDPTGLLDAASLFGKTLYIFSLANDDLKCFFHFQLTGDVIQLERRLQRLPIRSSTRSSMPPLLPDWVYCHKLEAPLPMTVIPWQQQRRLRREPITTRTRWQWPLPRLPVWPVCIQQVSKMSAHSVF